MDIKVQKSMLNYDKTNLASYLINLFGNKEALEALNKYFVGRSLKKTTSACILWRINKDKMLTGNKTIDFDLHTGKELKNSSEYGKMDFDQSNSKLCFFGEHLLSEYPPGAVGIVEREKTAIIASIIFPEITWLAKRGCNWLNYSVYHVLANRTVLLIPDFGFFNERNGKTCFEVWKKNADHIRGQLNSIINVSRVLENNINSDERIINIDFSDFLIKRGLLMGLNLSEFGHPMFKNVKRNNVLES